MADSRLESRGRAGQPISGDHALWEAHLIRGAARRDMTVAVEIMLKVGRDFERSMMKLADAARSCKAMSQAMSQAMAEMSRKLGGDTTP